MGDLKVKDVMTNLVVMLYPNDTVQEAARRLSRNGISGAPVVEHGKVVGMVSESDLIHVGMTPPPVDRGASVIDALAVLTVARPREHVHGKTMVDVMSPMVVHISPDASIWSAARLMDRSGIKRLPVLDDDGYLMGIISRADLVKSMARDDDQIAADLREAVGVLGEDVFEDLDIQVRDGVVTLNGTADRRSTRDIAEKIAARTPGVVEVVDRLHYTWDDARVHLTPVGPDPRANWNPDLSSKEVETL